MPTQGLAHRGGRGIGLRQRSFQKHTVEDDPIAPRAQFHLGTQDVGQRCRVLARSRHREGEAPEDKVRPHDLTLQKRGRGHVPCDQEGLQIGRQARLAEDQGGVVRGFLIVDRRKGVGQRQRPQGELHRVPAGRAADQGQPPDAIGREMEAQPHVQSQAHGIAEALDDIGDDAQFLGGRHVRVRLAKLRLRDPALRKRVAQRHAMPSREIDQHQDTAQSARKCPMLHHISRNPARTPRSTAVSDTSYGLQTGKGSLGDDK